MLLIYSLQVFFIPVFHIVFGIKVLNFKMISVELFDDIIIFRL